MALATSSSVANPSGAGHEGLDAGASFWCDPGRNIDQDQGGGEPVALALGGEDCHPAQWRADDHGGWWSVSAIAHRSAANKSIEYSPSGGPWLSPCPRASMLIEVQPWVASGQQGG